MSHENSADVPQLKRAAKGRWIEILVALGGMTRDQLDYKRNMPCPKCGGTNRFNAFKDVNETGGVNCRGCHDTKNGDGFSSLMWMLNKPFSEVVQLVGDFVGTGSKQQSAVKPKIVATYDYRDESGTLLFQVVRFEPKDFRQRMPNGSGWNWSIKGVRVVPYRLPELLAKPDETIFICEGEKDVDAVGGLGLLATCNAGGAKKWKDAHSAFVAGRSITIIADNDEPGREHAELACLSLSKHGCKVKVCRVTTGKDAADWIAAGATKEDFLRIAESTREVEPGGFEVGDDEPVEEEKKQHVDDMPQPLTVRELLTAYPKLRPPVIHGLLREGETMNVISAPKVGKSWLVNDLAIATAAGVPWLGQFDVVPGKVLIVDNELHGETSADRIPKVADARNIGLNDYGDRVLVANLRGRRSDIISMGALFEKFAPGELKIVIIDAWYRCLPPNVEENANGAMTNLYNIVDSYALKLGCAFVLVHHSSKGNQSGKAVTDVGSGAGSQSRATDTHLVLRAHQEEGAFVVDAAVRSWKPIEPTVLRWSFPVWNPADDLDPLDLKPDRPRKPRKETKVDTTPITKPGPPQITPETFAATIVGFEPKTKGSVVARAAEHGLSAYKTDQLLKRVEGMGLVHRWKFGRTEPHQFSTTPQNSIQFT